MRSVNFPAKNRKNPEKFSLFAPLHWPRRKDGIRQACYRISEAGAGNKRWLSSLLALNETQACFGLYIDGCLPLAGCPVSVHGVKI